MNGAKKILLILDLDETLMHASSELIREDFDFRIGHYFVYKRPYLEEFIRICAAHFQLAVWSSASDDYAAVAVKNIFPEDIPLAFVWGRSRCTPIFSPQVDEYSGYNMDMNSHYEYAKILKKIKRKGFSLERTLIIDDTPLKVRNCYGNAIYPRPFFGATDDNELACLAQYLLTLHNVQNVRIIEKRGWRNNYI